MTPTQKPGGFSLWLTLVHFGTSATQLARLLFRAFTNPRRNLLQTTPSPLQLNEKTTLTVNSLPVPLHLPIKHRIFILGQHLLLPWHLRLPPNHLLHALAPLRKRIIQRLDDGIDGPEAIAVSVLLVSG